MAKIVTLVFFFALPLLAVPCFAETCDAGHGCMVTCDDGCAAVYNEDTGGCSTGCGKALSAAQTKHRRINATFRDATKADVDKLLKNMK